MSHVIFLTVVFILYTSGNYYIFRKGQRASLHSLLFSKILYYTGSLLFFISFPLAMLGRDTFPLWLLKPMYFIGTSWLGIFFYMLLILTITDLVFRKQLKKNPKALKIRLISAYAISISLAVWGYCRFTSPTVIEQEIVITKPAGNSRELRIVGISDLHLGAGIGKERLKSYIRLINAQNPDMVLIAGDLVDNTIRPLEEERMYEEFRQIKAPMGIYACTGNHEYMGGGMEKCREFFRKSGIRLLEDDVVQVDSSFWIIGREDPTGNPNRKPLSELVAGTDQSQPLILLDHQPRHLEEALRSGIDLQFSGHTHNGQMFPGNIIASILFEIPHGYRKRGSTHYFVSSGLGIWGPLFRIGTESDLVVFKIKQ
jgi:predicted MPP superfamily phosphohydrolase